MAQLSPELRQTVAAFDNALTLVKESYVERDAVVDVVGLALMCREHVLLIGPPGTAKTALIEQLKGVLNARYFSYLLTKFTEPAEIFGALDVGLFRQGKYRINTDGMLPRAQIAFLDEIFNGSSAILNTLLTLINERRFHNGQQGGDPDAGRADLVTLLGATNELTDDPVLAAFHDRLLFRCRLDYVSPDFIEQMLRTGWESEVAELRGGSRADAGDRTAFAFADLEVLQRAVASVDLEPVTAQFAALVRALREQHAPLSDRRVVKAQKAIAANALRCGRGAAAREDLSVLVHLWTTEHQEKVLADELQAREIPLPAQNVRRRDASEVRYAMNRLRQRVADATAVEDLREVARLLGLLMAEARASHPHEDALLRDLGQAQHFVIQRLREQRRD